MSSARDREYASEWRLAKPLAVDAHRILWSAINRKVLPHPRKAGPCVDCGKGAHCYDHRDYTKPLAVEPVCIRCNRLRGPGFPYNQASGDGTRSTHAFHTHASANATTAHTEQTTAPINMGTSS